MDLKQLYERGINNCGDNADETLDLCSKWWETSSRDWLQLPNIREGERLGRNTSPTRLYGTDEENIIPENQESDDEYWSGADSLGGEQGDSEPEYFILSEGWRFQELWNSDEAGTEIRFGRGKRCDRWWRQRDEAMGKPFLPNGQVLKFLQDLPASQASDSEEECT